MPCTPLRTDAVPSFKGIKGIDRDVFVSTIPKITKASQSKIEEVCPIYLRYRRSANVNSSLDEVKKYLQTEFKKGDDEIVMAQIAGAAVGFLHYGIERSTLRPAERIRIKAMYVDEDHRGKGLAKQLLKKLQEEAGEREIVVKARRTNNISPNLYLNNGFEEDEKYYHLVYRETH